MRKPTPIDILILVVVTQIVSIAVLAIVGHIYEKVKLYAWMHGVGMSINTSLEFILVGLVLVLMVIDRK